MKHSIRFRFTMVFAGMMALAIAAILAINSCLLEDFYMKEKVKALEEAYVRIDRVLTELEAEGKDMTEGFYTRDDHTYWMSRETNEEEGGLPKILRQMSEESNTAVIMVNAAQGKAILFAPQMDFMERQMQQYILGQNNRVEDVERAENYMIQRRYDQRNKTYYLECWGFFSDNATAFLMSMPVAGIQDSVRLANQFLAYVGIAVLIVGSVVMMLLTRRMTSPILSLTKISEKMSRLDFEARYTGKAQDEIGILGNSMNTLSERLEETIGELKAVNNELKRDIRQKEKVDEMRKEFIANISHELKAPIALIQGYAEGLTEGMAEEKESREYYCDVIMDEANKMNKMVQQLLTLTALEFGSDELTMERFDLVDLIQNILNSSKILIDQKQASVYFNEEGPVYVWADEFKIEEVITNYLNNALNHLEGQRRIEIRILKRENDVKVSVFNTGQPIPEEDLPKIWTKFYKVDKARTREYGGSGIGLSIVKAIMDSHQKEYGAENRADGVEFWFTLDSSNS